MVDIWPEAHTVGAQLFMLVVYGALLFYGSKQLAHGSDVLRDIYGAGIIGGVVIPVLGALPDGIIILLSGLKDGTRQEIEEQLTVGVGALAGATIMLITVPLSISIVLGSRKLDDEGRAMSSYQPIVPGSNKLVLKPVLPERFSLTKNGATALPSTPKGAKWMIATSVTYLFIQIPAFFYHRDKDGGVAHERAWAIAGLVVASVLFIAYVVAMWYDSDNNEMIEERRHHVHKFLDWSRTNKQMIGAFDPATLFALLDRDGDGLLDAEDVRLGFKTIGLDMNHAEAQAFFNMMDADGNIAVDMDEFCNFVREFILFNDANKPLLETVGGALGLSQAMPGNASSSSSASSSATGSSHHMKRHSSGSGVYSSQVKTSSSGSFNERIVGTYIDREDHARPSHLWSTALSRGLYDGQGHGQGSAPLTDTPASKVSISSNEQLSEKKAVDEIQLDDTKDNSTSSSTGTTNANTSVQSLTLGIGSNGAMGISTPTQSTRILREAGSRARNPGLTSPGLSSPIAPRQSIVNNSIIVPSSLRRRPSDANALLSSTSFLGSSSDHTKTSGSRSVSTTLSPSTITLGTGIVSSSTVVGARMALSNKDKATVRSRSGSAVSRSHVAIAEDQPPSPSGALSGGSKLSRILAERHSSTPSNVSASLNVTSGRSRAHDMNEPLLGGDNDSIDLDIVDPTNTASSSSIPIFLQSQPTLLSSDGLHRRHARQPGLALDVDIPSHGHVGGVAMTPLTPAKSFVDAPKFIRRELVEEALDTSDQEGPGAEVLYEQEGRTEEEPDRTKPPKPLPPTMMGKLWQWLTDKDETHPVLLRIGKPERWATHAWASRTGTLGHVTLVDEETGERILKLFKLPATRPRRQSVAVSLMPRDPTLPRWASASAKLQQYVRDHTDITLKQLFDEADKSKSGGLTLAEVTEFVNTYHLDVSPASLKLYFHSHDTDLDRELSLRDFRRFLESFVAYSSTDEGEDSDSEHEEDDEVKTTEGHGHGGGNHMEGWSESKKKWYGIWLLLFGTGMVAIFSDPMIEVVGAFGNNIGVKPFYVSFLITPFASNAAEVIASLIFAMGKTNVSMGLTLSSLYGAASMNNTFCVAIFLALICIRELPWRYTAEVITIISVELAVAIICMRETLKQWHALIIASLFPLSMISIFVLEEVLHINN